MRPRKQIQGLTKGGQDEQKAYCLEKEGFLQEPGGGKKASTFEQKVHNRYARLMSVEDPRMGTKFTPKGF